MGNLESSEITDELVILHCVLCKTLKVQSSVLWNVEVDIDNFVYDNPTRKNLRSEVKDSAGSVLKIGSRL